MPLTSPQREPRRLCKHCRAPLREHEAAFCCAGCETAYGVISGRGWQDYYRYRDAAIAQPVAAVGPAPSFDYLDSADYRARHVRRENGLCQTSWNLDGLHCPACAWLVEKAARRRPGVVGSELSYDDGRLTLFFEERANLKRLAEDLAKLGYVAGLQSGETAQGRNDVARLGIAGALAANIMLMSVPFYTGLDGGAQGQLFAWLAFLLSIPLLLYGARDFFAQSLAALRHRAVTLDLPIALGLLSAFLYSGWQLLAGNFHQLYFDSMGMLVFFLLVGRHLQRNGVRRALAHSRRLLARMPQMTEVRRERQWLRLPAAEIEVGDLLRLRAGDVMPVDSALQSAEAILNLHVVSGESRPVVLERGAAALAGAVNMGASIEAKALTTWQDSKFARFESLSRALQGRKHGRRAGRMAAIFLAGVTVCAAAGLWLWAPVSLARAIAIAMTVFIVACPCALALARPTARAFALGRAAKLGVWIQSLDVFDRLPQVSEAVFDKTGMLTDGKPAIVQKQFFTANRHWLESAILALESNANHPLADAFRAELKPRLAAPAVAGVRVEPGAGVRGVVDGVDLVVSSPDGLAQFGVSRETQIRIREAVRDFSPSHTLVCAVANDRPAALFGLIDHPRPEAKALIDRLKRSRLEITLLSGDRQEVVDEVGAALGVDRRLGGLPPEQKLHYIDAARRRGALMAGDGLNDMGALAAATVGVTHGEASDAALKFADVVLQGRETGRIAALYGLAVTARRAVRRGVAVSLTYNTAAVSLTLAGLIGPLAAAILMPLSSLSLIALTAWTFRRSAAAWGF